MLKRILSMPLIVILLGICSAMMIVPAAHGLVLREFHVARVFFYSGIVFLILATMLGLTMQNRRVSNLARAHLLALVSTYFLLPLVLAIPLFLAVRDTRFINAYFEMVSALTTTGATVFDSAARLADPIHLWRAIVGWMGGFFAWVTAIAVMAPLSIGGFEVLANARDDKSSGTSTPIFRVANTSERLTRYSAAFFPVYAGLTLALWVALILAGDSSFVALCHAMSTLSTSGISPVGGLANAQSGMMGEVLIMVFLVFAISRQTFATDQPGEGLRRLQRDPELRMGLAIVFGLPVLLFMRHWVGAFEVDTLDNMKAAAHALWGGLFTVMSFLTTAGFESEAWGIARNWSGLETPGMILIGLSTIGGGVATTAGGVKLLRVFALYRHGTREMEKLVHPNSIGGSGMAARRMRRQGAYVAWMFFMLFAVSVAAVMTALSLTGLEFEASTVFTVAALSTTGPLALVGGEVPFLYSHLSDAAKMIVAGAMILGRIEMLAFVALLNPEFWRS